MFLTEEATSASRLRLPLMKSTLHDKNLELILYGLDSIDQEHA